MKKKKIIHRKYLKIIKVISIYTMQLSYVSRRTLNIIITELENWVCSDITRR